MKITTESVKQLTKKFYLEALYFVGILLEDSWGFIKGLNLVWELRQVTRHSELCSVFCDARMSYPFFLKFGFFNFRFAIRAPHIFMFSQNKYNLFIIFIYIK